MSTYRERRLAKAERLRGWAEGSERKSDAALEEARRRADVIPLGQPILVGHHSEGRDRRYRAGIARKMDQGVEHGRKAEDMRRRADGIEAAAASAVYSDDPDAVERLEERIADLEGQRDRLKRYNASCRRGAPDPTILDAAQQEQLQVVERVGQVRPGGQFPAYATSNLSGNIARLRRRLEDLR